MEFSQKTADSPWISPLGSWMTRGIFRQTHNALTSSKFSPHASRGSSMSSRSLLADLFKVLTWKLMIPNSFMVHFMVYFMEHPTEKWMIWGTPWYPPTFTWCYMMLNLFYDIVILTSLAHFGLQTWLSIEGNHEFGFLWFTFTNLRRDLGAPLFENARSEIQSQSLRDEN